MICIKNRESLQLLPLFPFSALEVNVFDSAPSQETLETFGAALGHHVKRYLFRVFSFSGGELALEVGGKVATLLSHSPELADLQVQGIRELFVSDQALHLLPKTFPNLSDIRVFGLFRFRANQPRSSYPLIDLLVERATQLKRLTYPVRHRTQNQCLRILRSLAQTRPNNLPYFYFEGNPFHRLSLSLHIMFFIRKLRDLPIRFTELSLSIGEWRSMDFLDWMPTVFDWLEMQSSTLTDLEIELQDGIRFPLPPLPALRTLKLVLPNPKYKVLSYFQWGPLINLPTGNPFPVLKKLYLENYEGEDSEIFQGHSFPSVEELHLRVLPGPFPEESFIRRSFPNLTSIRVSRNSSPEVWVKIPWVPLPVWWVNLLLVQMVLCVIRITLYD